MTVRGIVTAQVFKDEGVPPARSLIFTCPHCKNRHGILISFEKASLERQTHQSGAYSINGWPVWIASKLDEYHIRIEPSFDGSQLCGYHSPYNWDVEVLFEEDNDINHDIWLNAPV